MLNKSSNSIKSSNKTKETNWKKMKKRKEEWTGFNLFDDAVSESDGGQRRQETDESIAVPLEPEIDRRRVHDCLHQRTLGRLESGRRHGGCQLLVVVETRLDDSGAAEQRVPRVLLRMVNHLRLERQRCFHHRHTLAYPIEWIEFWN